MAPTCCFPQRSGAAARGQEDPESGGRRRLWCRAVLLGQTWRSRPQLQDHARAAEGAHCFCQCMRAKQRLARAWCMHADASSPLSSACSEMAFRSPLHTRRILSMTRAAASTGHERQPGPSPAPAGQDIRGVWQHGRHGRHRQAHVCGFARCSRIQWRERGRCSGPPQLADEGRSAARRELRRQAARLCTVCPAKRSSRRRVRPHMACAQIRGLTKKGKEFFRFTTSLTEPIARLAVANRWAQHS